jgi:hypothetical protein
VINGRITDNPQGIPSCLQSRIFGKFIPLLPITSFSREPHFFQRCLIRQAEGYASEVVHDESSFEEQAGCNGSRFLVDP